MSRPTSPALTDAEARVMHVLWRRGASTVADVVTALTKKRTANYSTVQTILRILESKGYVAHDKVVRAFIYTPVVDERQARHRALRHLARRLFDNSPSLLVQNVLDDEQLDPAELRRLKALIDRT
jgi:BlaI family transcriptional regulator, penicillinase repressor